MGEHSKSLTTLRTTVTMGKQNAQLGDEPEITVGTAIYAKRPNGKDTLVRIDWQKPKESLAVAGGKYVMYRERLGTAYVGSVDKASKDAKGANSALAFMNMSRAQLRENYTVEMFPDGVLSTGEKTFHLKLTPKVKTSYQYAELWVDTNGMPIQTKVVENNNDSTTILLTNLQKNPKISATDFVVEYPKGTKVVKS